MITKIPERVTEVTDTGRLGRSYNILILTKVNITQPSKIEKRPSPDWNKTDWSRTRSALGDLNWQRLLANTQTEKAWTIFKDEVHNLVKWYVPKNGVTSTAFFTFRSF